MEKASKAWPQVEFVLRVPHNDHQYKQLVKLLNRLVDKVGECEKHQLASLMEIISVLIEKYEDDHIPKSA